MIHPEFAQSPTPSPYRQHECRNGHLWKAPVKLSTKTQNISGEHKPDCPTCGSRALYSSAWMREDGSQYFRK